MKKLKMIPILFLILFFTAQSAASDRFYISDTHTVTLRTGPSNENKILKMLKSGQELKILESGEKWSHVGVLDNNEVKLEGWVLTQYLIDRVPYEIQAQTLSAENEKLKERLSTANEQLSLIRKEKNDLTSQFQQTQKEMTSLMNEYETLKTGSSQYLQLKAEYESNLEKLQKTEHALKELEIQMIKTKESHAQIWFAIGALVLLFGLVIGSIIGRQSRKKSSSYLID